MFDQHQTIIASANVNPDHLSRVVLLAILSARMPFHRLRDDLPAVLRGSTGPLFAWKARAWSDHQDYAEYRYHKLEQISMTSATDRDAEIAMLVEVSTWYGLGFVKGGFIVQMLYGLAGCLDVRNADAYDLPDAILRAPEMGITDKRRRTLAVRYADQCAALGGPARLWDAWCADYKEGRFIFDNDGGWNVSAEHCRLLGLDPGPCRQACDIPF